MAWNVRRRLKLVLYSDTYARGEIRRGVFNLEKTKAISITYVLVFRNFPNLQQKFVLSLLPEILKVLASIYDFVCFSCVDATKGGQQVFNFARKKKYSKHFSRFAIFLRAQYIDCILLSLEVQIK